MALAIPPVPAACTSPALAQHPALGCVLLAAEVAPVVLGISLFGLFLLLTGSVSSIALLVSIALHHLGRKSR